MSDVRPSRRVVVTGIGLIAPVGTGTQESWSALLAGESGVGPITQFDTTDHPVTIAGEQGTAEPRNAGKAGEPRC